MTMESSEFSKELDKALRLCRAAAELPIEDMLEHAEAVAEAALNADDRERYGEMSALCEIFSAVGDVAAIGSKLPAAEAAPAELSCPLPANLRSPQ